MDKEQQKKRKFHNSPSPPSSMEIEGTSAAGGESEDSLSEDESLEKELLRIKSSFLRRIELLFMDPEEDLPAGHPPPYASSYIPPLRVVNHVTNKCSFELGKMRNCFFRMEEESLTPGAKLELQQEVLAIKSREVPRIQALFKETVQESTPPLLASSSYFPTNEVAVSCIRHCLGQLQSIGNCVQLIEDESHPQSDESGDELQPDAFYYPADQYSDAYADINASNADARDDDDMDDASGSDSPEQSKEKELFSWSSMNGNEETEGRYLCVSNGFAIWCLDLKQSSSDPPGPLPRIATLNLLGKRGLPASVGLFKLGSDAYVIGGQQLSGSIKRLSTYVQGKYNLWSQISPPWATNIYNGLCYEYGVKGSSCVAYRLSLSAVDGTLSHAEAGGEIEQLRKPKVWPIVERVDGKLNVLESVPFQLQTREDLDPYSHEVRDSDGGGWKEIPTIFDEETDRIMSHVVVGKRIFAVAGTESSKHHYLVFNSRTEKWKGCRKVEYSLPFEVRRVWDIIDLGIGRCAGEFRLQGQEPLYVLIALVENLDNRNGKTVVVAVAYIVTSTGKVVCYQRLPGFYKADFGPREIRVGTMIHVDDDDDKFALLGSTTMCSVVSSEMVSSSAIGKEGGGGGVYGVPLYEDSVFVNTFCVELLPDAALKVEQLLGKRIDKDRPLAELEFVRVTPKHTHVLQTDASGRDDAGRFVGWRACFLTPMS